jgi:serine/threonine-protein kinase RsbW
MAEGTDHTLTLMAPPDDVDVVHDLLATVWADYPGVSAIDRMSFETALIELAANVILHSRTDAGVQCDMTVAVVDGRIEARLSDTGLPGGVELASRSMPDEMSETGRGIPLIQALVDVVEYDHSDSRNHWRISRTLER